MTQQAEQLPERCELHHRVFTTLGGVRFHRAAQDGCPVMAVTLGAREASIPLKSLRREFDIADQSHDGMMLELVGRSLDYVLSLQPGDRFPPELLTGDASWRPTRNHVRVAATRLGLDLVCWLAPSSRWARAQRDVETLLRLADNAAFQADVEAMAGHCAEQLGMAGPDWVLQTLEDLSRELSFIEALRDSLMMRVERLTARLLRLRPGRAAVGRQAETVVQVGRLGTLAEKQLRSRFDDVDAQTRQVATMLNDVDAQRGFIRSNRDWLYRSERAWQPLLDQWDDVREDVPAELMELLTHTYQFLAPRFMPTMEWGQQRRGRAPGPAAVAW